MSNVDFVDNNGTTRFQGTLRGGGAGLPPEWTVAPDGQLKIENTGPDAGLIVAPTDATTEDLLLVAIPATYENDSAYGWLIRAAHDPSTPGDYVFAAELQGLFFKAGPNEGLGVVDVQSTDFPNNRAQLGSQSLNIESDDASINLVEDAGPMIFRAGPAGIYFTSAHVAPADNTLQAGEVAFWFDQTNGAAKLMVKGKSADGTIVTGSLALA